jgi:O-antigen/teichoic acid export membrane protein
MSGTKSTIAAALFSQGVTMFLGILFVPIYIRLMGIDGYGLTGFYAVIQAIAGVLDLGLGATTAREIARRLGAAESTDEVPDLARTLEIAYWGIGAFIAITVAVASSYLASKWLTSERYSPDQLHSILLLMAGLLFFQWPNSLYQSGLLGLQRQVASQFLQAAFTTGRGVGAVLVLWLVQPTPFAFFLWQLVWSIVQVFSYRSYFWLCLPRGQRRPRFKFAVFKEIYRFAAGMSITSILGLVLAQADKVLLSRLLPLKSFGYYTLAGTLAGMLSNLNMPVYTAFFPLLCSHAARGERAESSRWFHKGCQTNAALVLPVGVIAALFPYEILWVWTGNPETAAHVAPIARLLVIGTTLNALMTIPYALLVAHGWTRLMAVCNGVAFALIVPLIFGLTKIWGAVGAAVPWVILNACYVILVLPIIIRRLLPGELTHWWRDDFLLPLLGAMPLAVLARGAAFAHMARWTVFVSVAAVGCGVAVAAALATPSTRQWAFREIRRLRRPAR